MNIFQRKIIACVASIINGHENSLRLFDHDKEEVTQFYSQVNKKGFDLLNAKKQVLYSVEKKPVKWIIRNQVSKKIIELEKYSDQFKGYDFESSSYFTIIDLGNELKMYDYQSDDFHYYSLEKQFQ